MPDLFKDILPSILVTKKDALGDEEQKERILGGTINMDKTISFGLTEAENGSDATGLKTNAK